MDEEQATWNYTGSSEALDPHAHDSSIQPITWEASEYIAHEKPAAWYLALTALTFFVTTIVYIVNRDLITSFAILTVAACAGILASRKPASRQYELSGRGLTINGRLFEYKNFRSFSVVEDGAINSIWIKPLNRYQPAITLYFSPEDEEHIVTILSSFLPFEQKELDAIDRMSRKLRF